MKTIPYEVYFDKVYGCFLGKCVGGTAGGPAEGRKELLDAPLNEDLLHTALPNDDLDLQILWLELLEDKGIHITARDMADEFYHKVPYGPGEYGFFKKNYGRGIYPPVSGRYNNRYYKNGMGCPIRSEIWACLFPGAPEYTFSYVEKDGSLDHEHDSIQAEYFLASVEADAFFESDLLVLLKNGIARMEPDTKIQNVLRDTIRWYEEGHEWKYTRGMILRHYGHSDCTNLYQNMGFTLLSLLYGAGDMRETIRLGLACGYDTDCICATAASILGILRGAQKMLTDDGLTDTGLCIEVHTRRRKGSIRDLAKDVCAAGMSMADAYETEIRITDRPEFIPLKTEYCPALFTAEAQYEGDPVLLYGKETHLTLKITANADAPAAVLTLDVPEGLTVFIGSDQARLPTHTALLSLQQDEYILLPLTVCVTEGVKRLAQKNIFTVTIESNGDVFTDTFGLVGGDIWYRYGPFLMNNKDLSFVPPHEKYGAHIPLLPGENRYDVLRDFHLSNFADIHREFVPETLPFTAIAQDGRAECVPERICLSEDLFDLADIQSFEGPHTDYLVRYFESPEERTLELAVGHTAPFKLWLNGEYIGGCENSAWWTCENKHFTVTFRKGENIMILKCAQPSDSAKYSVIPRLLNGRWRQWEDFVSLVKD